MLKTMSIRKITVATLALCALLLLYLIPSSEKEVSKQLSDASIEYIYTNAKEVIYLLDDNNYLSRTNISASNKNIISKSTDLIEALIIDGKKKDILTDGFEALIPKNTKINVYVGNKYNVTDGEYFKKYLPIAKQQANKILRIND